MAGKTAQIPGFVDLQVNGFKGVNFSSPKLTEEDFVKVCSALLRKGTTAFLPTVITSPKKTYQHNLPLIAKAITRSELKGRLLGIHLEGPFISPKPGAVGCHNPKHVREPDTDLLKKMIEWAHGRIRLITLAAEMEGADHLAKFAVGRGITVSVGHSLADSDDLKRLADAGATAFTHLGNGIPNRLPRHPNTIWAGLAEDQLSAMLITDGHHLPPSVIKTAIRAKGIDKTIVVSDMSFLAGMPPGPYKMDGNDVVLEESGKLHVPKKKCLAGSSATMKDCMDHLESLELLSEDELNAVGFYNPLRLISVAPSVIGGTAP